MSLAESVKEMVIESSKSNENQLQLKQWMEDDSWIQMGQELYQVNEIYKNMCNTLEHPEFKQFFQENFSDWHSTKHTLMLIKAYEAIGQKLEGLSPYSKLAILHTALQNRETRQQLVIQLNEFIKDKDSNHSLHLLPAPPMESSLNIQEFVCKKCGHVNQLDE